METLGGKSLFQEETSEERHLRYQHNRKVYRHDKRLQDPEYSKHYKEQCKKRYDTNDVIKKQRSIDDPEYKEKSLKV